MRNLFLVCVSLCLSALGQTKGPAFDVTSVKPQPLGRGDTITVPRCTGGQFVSVGPLPRLISWAYGLDVPLEELARQMPEWAVGTANAYDVRAASDGPVSETQCRLMVRSLLADRFKLAAHLATKEGTVYDLVIARGGPKLQRMKEGDSGPTLILNVNGRRSPGMGPPQGLTMSNFASFLKANLAQIRLSPSAVPVIDKTGLQGNYKIELTYSVLPRTAPKDAILDGPELEVALEQQLGLRLVERKGPIDVFVIDRIERPEAN